MNTERIKQAMAQLATLNAKITSNSACNASSEENHANAIEIVLDALQSFLELGITPEQMREIDKLYAEKWMELSEKVAFDFDRAINALKENQEYKKLGTLEEVREAVEKQRAISREIIEGKYFCPKCHNLMPYPGYCGCGQKLY